MHNTDKMKKTDLQEIIRQSIQEVINELTVPVTIDYKNKNSPDKILDIDPSDINTINKLKVDPTVGSLTVKDKKIKEGELEEFANQPARYELNPDIAAADFTGKKSQIVAAMQATEEPMTKLEVAIAMGYDKQNPISDAFISLVNDGAIIPSTIQTAPRFNRPVTEPAAGEEEGEEGIEGGIAGDMSDEEIEASFAKAMASGEEEPDAGEIEKANVAAGGMSDVDYEAFMKYTDLEDRLSRVKSDILKAKRSRPSIGDISDQPSNELQNLRDLKTRLQAKLDDLLAGSEYLQARKTKMTKKAEPEDTNDEEQLDEWMKGRMQYYAGIRK
jgi:hypothetical protein